jgi:hypothetical protein
MTLSRCLLAACSALLIAQLATAQDRDWGVNRSIEQISPSVFRWGSDAVQLIRISEKQSLFSSLEQ